MTDRGNRSFGHYSSQSLRSRTQSGIKKNQQTSSTVLPPHHIEGRDDIETSRTCNHQSPVEQLEVHIKGNIRKRTPGWFWYIYGCAAICIFLGSFYASYAFFKHGSRKRVVNSNPLKRQQIASSISFGSKQVIDRLSPPEDVAEQASMQIDDELMVMIGGFTGNYDTVSRSLQFFNISNQRWLPERRLDIPPGVGDTHVGYDFDPKTRMLYLVSGQLGGGCNPATTAVARINVDNGAHEELPPLPKARYDPGVALASDPSSNNGQATFLHVFGGVSEMRNSSRTDHWRLSLVDNKASWKRLEDIPQGGGHSASFSHDGFLYSTAYGSMDQGMMARGNTMQKCQATAFDINKQLLHHNSDVGLTFRYATAGDGHWERLDDMPYPACHAGFVLADDRVYFVGGALTTTQIQYGSSPNSLNMIQAFNLDSLKWEEQAFELPENTNAYKLSVWIDSKQKRLFGLRPRQTALIAQLESNLHASNNKLTNVKEHVRNRIKYLEGERSMAVNAISSCIDSQISQLSSQQTMEKHTIYDSTYDEVRTTWNKRNSHLQYPDMVTFPKNSAQIGAIVQCARRTGHHICARNGKHSFEGDTCTYGIVVDVAHLDSVEKLGPRSVRFGAGLHLGRVALELERHGLTLPVGHCASVGLTGLLLVGGQGVLTRHLGLPIDYVSAIELVDHKGQVIRATKDEHSDYLWLARGGGSAVQHYPGIITSIEFDNLPKLDVIDSSEEVYTTFKIDYEATVENAVHLLLAWQEFYLEEDNNADPIFSRLTVEPWLWWNRGHGPSLFISVYFYGDSNMHQMFLDRFVPRLMALLDGGIMSNMQRLDALSFHRQLAGVKDNVELASGKHGWDLRENQFSLNRWKGYSAVASHRTSANAFRKLAQSIFNSKAPWTRYVEFKPIHSNVVRRVNQTETAFWHRDALWWSLSSHWHLSTDPSDFVEAIQQSSGLGHAEFVGEMKKDGSYSGQYAGYIDHSNSTGRDLELYYGGNAVRIAQIKKERDPDNIFRIYKPNKPNALTGEHNLLHHLLLSQPRGAIQRGEQLDERKNAEPTVSRTHQRKDQIVIVDVVSIGSETRLEYLTAQADTWASHNSVRHFWGVTERQDYDVNCSTMSDEELQSYLQTCRESQPRFGQSKDGYRNDAGWVCAQRRPGRVLGWLQSMYQNDKKTTMPDILLLVDDDTSVNIEMVKKSMRDTQSSNDPLVSVGCLIYNPAKPKDIFAYGGQGIFLNKEAIKRMTQPIFCNEQQGERNEFTTRTCSRLRENLHGEFDFFQQGDSLFGVFYKYSAQKYFCENSDWVLSYMLQSYSGGMQQVNPQDFGCWDNPCNLESVACHYQTPIQMKEFASARFEQV